MVYSSVENSMFKFIMELDSPVGWIVSKPVYFSIN